MSFNSQPFLKLFFVATALSVILFIINTIPYPEINKTVLAIEMQTETQTETQILSMRLKIPIIKVDALIEDVGIAQSGIMDVPKDIADVGWFKFGPRPGESGSAVIDGHFDNANGRAAVFANLDKLKVGDKIYVDDNRGISTTFVVRASHVYNPGNANDVFGESNGSHLNLITCDGVWDGVKKGYSKRLVIFTDILI